LSNAGEKLEYNGAVHKLFVDFKRVNDSIRREVLYNIVIEFEVPTKRVKFIKICLNKTYNKVRTVNYYSGTFPIQNGLKQGDALRTLLFNFALVYTIMKVQLNEVRLKINGTPQVLVYVDDVNVVRGNINAVKKDIEALIDARKELHMFMFRHQNAEQNYDVKIVNMPIGNGAKLKYFGIAVTNQNLIHEETTEGLNSSQVYYHSVHNGLSSRLVSKP
jgi:hypothetical protein